MKDPTRAFRRRGLDEDGKRLASEAYRLWRELAEKRGNPYSDHQYCLRAGWAAVEATRWEDGLTILAAIRRNLDEKAVPARIAEWARLEGADRRIAEHRARDQQERLEPLAPRVAAIMPAHLRPQRPHPSTHAFTSSAADRESCGFAPDGIPCGGPPGVHVRELARKFEALEIARRNTKDRRTVQCPECEEWAEPGHECPRCGTFLTTGPKDDAEQAMTTTLRLWHQADAEKPLHGIGE